MRDYLKYQYTNTMDIDITDAAFSLDVPITKDFTSADGLNFVADLSGDNTIYIYIAIFIVLSFIGIFIYKYYQSNKKINSEMVCEGGFCTMEQTNDNELTYNNGVNHNSQI